MDFEKIAFDYYYLSRINLEKITPAGLKDGMTLFLPKGNEFRILEDILSEGEKMTCRNAYKGDYNPRRIGYPTKVIWMIEDKNRTAEIKIADDIFLIT